MKDFKTIELSNYELSNVKYVDNVPEVVLLFGLEKIFQIID